MLTDTHFAGLETVTGFVGSGTVSGLAGKVAGIALEVCCMTGVHLSLLCGISPQTS